MFRKNQLQLPPAVTIYSFEGVVTITRNGEVRSYVGKNGENRNGVVFIDDREVTEDDLRRILTRSIPKQEDHAPYEYKTTTEATGSAFGFSSLFSKLAAKIDPSIAPKQQPLENNTSIDTNEYSPHARAYIKTFIDQPKNTDRLNKLSLSEEEQQLFEAYHDPVHHRVIDIPVMLYERLYNLNTLLDILAVNPIDPGTEQPFTKRDIQAARNENEKLKTLIQEIEQKHSQLDQGERKVSYGNQSQSRSPSPVRLFSQTPPSLGSESSPVESREKTRRFGACK